jgi:hypothetical protein
MDEHCASGVLEVADTLFGQTVLEVGTDAGVGDGLATGVDGGNEFLFGKAAIVRMIVANLNTVRGCESLKGVLGGKGVIARGGELVVDEGDVAILVDEDGRNLVTVTSVRAFQLADEAGGGRFQLVDGDAVAWGGNVAGVETTRGTFSPPRSASGFAKDAAGAKRDTAGCQSAGEMTGSGHRLKAGIWRVAKTMVPVRPKVLIRGEVRLRVEEGVLIRDEARIGSG